MDAQHADDGALHPHEIVPIPPSPGWNEERIETLTRMWAEGYSASIIGAEIGMTRNAVVGKRMRLGLPMRREKLAPRISRRNTHDAPRARPPRPRGSVVAADIPLAPSIQPAFSCESVNVDLLELRHHHCRYVTGAASNRLPLYCGMLTSFGSWCRFHAQEVFA